MINNYKKKIDNILYIYKKKRNVGISMIMYEEV